MKVRNLVSLSLAALAVSFSAVAPTFAQDKMGGKMAGHSDKMGGKMAAKSDKKMSGVYVCKECKMGFTASQAKKMDMKDPMGHPLTKMAKMPSGMKMAPADAKMGGKMGDHKMGGDKKM